MKILSSNSFIIGVIMLGISCNLSNRPVELSHVSPKIRFSIDSTAGNLTTVSPILNAGTGGMSVDQEGKIMVADFGSYLDDMGDKGDKIYRISPDDESSVWVSGFQGASGNNFDSEGNLFQSNIGGNFISKITSEGELSTFAKKGLSSPVGIEIDQNDNLFVCSCGNNSIRKISKDGDSREFVKSELLNCLNGITMDDSGIFYVSNFYDGSVVKILPDGTSSILAIIPGENNGHLIYYDNF